MRFCPSCRSIYTAHVECCGIDGTRLATAEVDPLIGYEVDRYVVLDRVGVGAMGCVYRVRHTVLEQEHAMKILYGDLGKDLRIVERFKREAKAISRMRHPNILSVNDFGRTQNGLMFLVMELVKGMTLLDEITFNAPFSLGRTIRITSQIAAALGEAHRHGFVHRDVKPANIMIDGESSLDHVKILDFGIVGLCSEAFDTRLTGHGFIVGTPAYMSPEQARDPTEVSPAADLYSLGVILFEMLTGRLPFDAADPLDMILQHTTMPIPELPRSGGLERLCYRLLAKRPEDRPQSAGEILQALSRVDPKLENEVPELGSPDDPLPLLDPITYRDEEAFDYEHLRGRLDRMEQALESTSEIETQIREAFEVRLAEMSAAVRPGLREFRYADLAAKIADLEHVVWGWTRLADQRLSDQLPDQLPVDR